MMHTWEYLFVVADYAGEWRPHYVNAEPLPNWKELPNIAVYANQLGQQGWELINVVLVTEGRITLDYVYSSSVEYREDLRVACMFA